MSEPIQFPDPAPHILVVDDERMIRWTLRSALEDAGAHVDEAASLGEARRRLDEEWPDLVILDLRLPDGDGLEFLAELRTTDLDIPVLVITAHGSVEGAVQAMRLGANDYVVKPFDLDDLLHKAARTFEQGHLRRLAELRGREDAVDAAWPVAAAPATLQLVKLLQRIGRSGASTVLLTGESGTGKGLAARTLHAFGGQGDRPFISVTCTAIPETLLESELFGHERGAFTDARESKRGLAELAFGGTLFLDEIGDLPQSTQAKMLTLLEERVFRRVGGTRQHRLEARVVAATNRDLEREVQAGRFRADLYYRLKVVPVVIPPLRERIEDVRPLAEHFLSEFSRQFQGAPGAFREEAMLCLEAYGWPGNVRELRNAVERAALLGSSHEVGLEDLPAEVAGVGSGSALAGLPDLPASGCNLAALERRWVEQALMRCTGNRSRAARLLGMNRDQMRYRIDKYGITPDQTQVPQSPAED